MRASDRDRERVLAALRAGCAEGYLSIDTFERRELRPTGDGRWLALDVGSLNGTWLLDGRVGRVMVGRGDELWLGSCPVRLA